MDLYPEDQLTLRRRGCGTLRTSRLVLRPFAMDDATPLAEAIGTYDVARWLGRIPYPYREDDARAFIAKAKKRVGRDWVIERDGGLIGGISVDHELGYWFARSAWGQGFATEACDAVVDAYFADRRAKTLASGHMPDNLRSSGVLAKQGFRYTGEVRTERSGALSQSLTSRVMVLDRGTWIARRRFRLALPGLALRELRPGDLPAILRLGARPDTGGVFGTSGAAWSERMASDWLERFRFRGRLEFALAICRWRRVVGVIAVRPAPNARALCEVAIDPACCDHGDAALAAVVPDVLARFGLSGVAVPQSSP